MSNHHPITDPGTSGAAHHSLRPVFLVGLAVVGLAVGGGTMAAAAGGDAAVHASATLRDASDEPVGFALFTEDSTGALHVTVHARGMTAGLHGIHVHNVADCTPGAGPYFLASGTHHNPLGAQHGELNGAGPHAGDLPNLSVNRAGIGMVTTTLDLATLSSSAASLFDTDGSALVIHAGPDDLVTDPTGNSGGRIACGVIEPE